MVYFSLTLVRITNLVSSFVAFVIKPASIRIWIHEKDYKKLTKVLWEGQGMRLIRETSSNRKMKSFLGAVPYVMSTIRDVHKAAVDNDIELIKRASEDPVPPVMLACKDKNGLTPLHKVRISQNL